MTILFKLVGLIATMLFVNGFYENGLIVMTITTCVLSGWFFLSMLYDIYEACVFSWEEYVPFQENVTTYRPSNNTSTYSRGAHTTTAIDEMGYIKSVLKIRDDVITYSETEKKKVDIDGSPIVEQKPPQIVTTPQNRMVETAQEQPKGAVKEAILIHNGEPFTSKLETIFKTIVDCIELHTKNDRLAQKIMECIYHVDLVENGVVIYYKKLITKYGVSSNPYPIPFEAIKQAIKFRMDNKDYNVIFDEMTNKTVTEYYIEHKIKA